MSISGKTDEPYGQFHSKGKPETKIRDTVRQFLGKLTNRMTSFKTKKKGGIASSFFCKKSARLFAFARSSANCEARGLSHFACAFLPVFFTTCVDDSAPRVDHHAAPIGIKTS